VPGPGTEDEAFTWIREAFEGGRYITTVHFGELMAERGVDFSDVSSAISRATHVARYANDVAQQEGTCWRVFGPDLDEERSLVVAVEAFLDKKRRRVVLVTVFEVQG
jgi:hypothetical protein